MGSPAGPPMAGPPPAGGFAGPAAAAALSPAPASANVICPQCGASNQPTFKFCGSCGYVLQGASPAPAAPVAPPTAGRAPRGTLVLIRPDGTEGESISIDDQTVMGRATMPQFASDSYLSPRHATFHFGPGLLRVRDESSLNGIYLRIERDVPMELVDRTIFRVGQEIIRLERFPAPVRGPDGVEPMGSPRHGLIGRICLVTGRETTGNCYAIPAEGLHLGRERGDILFPEDGYVSGLHARIHAEGERVFLTDVGSSNGTFMRIEREVSVPSGAMLLMGQQLFRVEY